MTLVWIAVAAGGAVALALAAGYAMYYLIEWIENRWPQR